MFVAILRDKEMSEVDGGVPAVRCGSACSISALAARPPRHHLVVGTAEVEDLEPTCAFIKQHYGCLSYSTWISPFPF